MLFVDDTQGQGHGARRLRIGERLEIVAVDVGRPVRVGFLESLGIGFVAQCLCHLAHQPEFVGQITVEEQGVVRLLHLEAEPVAQFTPVSRRAIMAVGRVYPFLHHHLHIALHRRVVLAQRGQVVVLLITLPGHHDAYALPQRTAKAAAYRGDVGEGTIVLLRIAQGRQMAAQELRPVEQVTHRGGEDGEVAAPAHPFVALRTVGGY